MKNLLFITLLLIASLTISAQTTPGDYFKEYYWHPKTELKTESFLRVGGRYGYADNQKLKDEGIVNADNSITLPFKLDLQKPLKVELVLEKIQSHEGTHDLRVSFNGNPSIEVPQLQIESTERNIDFMAHYYPTIPVPKSQLNATDNRIKLTVDSVQNWGWPQNIFYGIILRVYYENPYEKSFNFSVEIPSDSIVKITPKFSQEVREIDYLFKGEGVNWEGDGDYNQWHYHFHQTEISHHIGSSKNGISWNTSWIPDQKDVKIGARIHFNDGSILFREIGETDIQHKNYQVILAKPYDIPAFWSTRSGEFSEHFDVNIDPKKIKEAKLYWTSWSPCYSNGVLLNGHLVTNGKGPCYDYFAHEVPVENVKFFNEGKNKITTLLTPLFQGEMVHGMEVQYPGIMVKMKVISEAGEVTSPDSRIH